MTVPQTCKPKGPNKSMIPAYVLGDARFLRYPAALLTLTAVASFPKDAEGWTYAGQKAIAARARQHTQHAGQYLKLLVGIGVLETATKPNPQGKGRALLHYRIRYDYAPPAEYAVAEGAVAEGRNTRRASELITQDVRKSGELVTQDVTNKGTQDVTKSGELVTFVEGVDNGRGGELVTFVEGVSNVRRGSGDAGDSVSQSSKVGDAGTDNLVSNSSLDSSFDSSGGKDENDAMPSTRNQDEAEPNEKPPFLPAGIDQREEGAPALSADEAARRLAAGEYDGKAEYDALSAVRDGTLPADGPALYERLERKDAQAVAYAKSLPFGAVAELRARYEAWLRAKAAKAAPASAAPPPPRQRQPAGGAGRAVPFPPDFEITDELDQFAAQHAPNVNLARELEKMRLWAHDKAATSHDWPARFRSWLLSAEERTPGDLKRKESHRRPDGTWERAGRLVF